jgi:hypothetical protein
VSPASGASPEIRPARRRPVGSTTSRREPEGPDRALHGAVVGAGADMFSADFGFLYLPGSGGPLEFATRAPSGGKPPPIPATLPSKGWTPGFHDCAPFPAPLSRVAGRSPLESWWVLPLEGERRLEGLLLLAWEARVEIDPDDLDRGEAIADLLGSVLRRLRSPGACRSGGTNR